MRDSVRFLDTANYLVKNIPFFTLSTCAKPNAHFTVLVVFNSYSICSRLN